MYMLIAPVNSKRQPIAPSRQLCTTWTAEVLGGIPEELIRKAWKCCRYKNIEYLENLEGSANAVVENLVRYYLMQVVEEAAVATALEHFRDPGNEIDDPGDDEDEEDTQEEHGTWEV